jgi:hypothetical protein
VLVVVVLVTKVTIEPEPSQYHSSCSDVLQPSLATPNLLTYSKQNQRHKHFLITAFANVRVLLPARRLNPKLC